MRKLLTSCTAGLAAFAVGAIANAAVLVGVQGEFYDTTDPILNVSAAEAIITSRAGPDATWTVSAIDYPNGADKVLSGSASLAQLLGVDAPSLSQNFATIGTSAFRLVGQIFLDGTESIFTVESDDGFVLRIGGAEISRFEGERTTDDATSVMPNLPLGLYTFEMVYFDNEGTTGSTFAIDGEVVRAGMVPTDPIPLPGAALFMLTGIGALVVRRRKSA